MTSSVPYSTAGERAAARASVRDHLAADGIIAYPTETVYGLGCALRPRALGALRAFKGARPFLLLIPSAGAAAALRWTPAARRLAQAFWPGPLTLVLDDPQGAFPAEVRGQDGAVAVRVSPHPAIPDLLDAAGGPITSTSANLPGSPAARDANAALELAPAIDRLLVLDGGRLAASASSTMVRCGDRIRILRAGAVERADIERVTEVAS